MTFAIPARQPPKRSQRKKDLYRLLLARSDIGAANTACQLFLRTVSDLKDELYYPLFTAIVVCYARPFTANEPFGALPRKWAKFSDARSQSLHDDLLRARHELVAHSDATVRTAKIIPPDSFVGYLGDEKRELRSGKRIGTETSYYLFQIPRIRQIPTITLDLTRRLNAEIDTLVDDLYGGMELPRGKFRLRIDEGL